MSTNANPPRGALGPAPKAKAPTIPNGLGRYGFQKTPDERYLFGTDPEIRNRNATGYTLGGTPPEEAPPHFEQIVAGPTSKDLNAPGKTEYQGNSKFGNPRRFA